MAIYHIKRGNTVLASVKAQGTQTKDIMTRDDAVLSFKSPTKIELRRRDTVEVYGQIYELNEPEDVLTDNSIDGYSYEATFEAVYYRLNNWTLKTLDQNNQLRQPLVYVMAKPWFILDLIVRNANENDIEGGWSIGIVDNEQVLQHSYPSVTCLAALQDLASRCETEFWFDGPNGKRVNLSIREESSGIVLEKGKGKGLYSFRRIKSDKPYFNRLVIEGGDKNLPEDYGFKSLQLPASYRPWLDHPSVSDWIIDKYVKYENIFPHRIGTVTAVGGSLEIYDTNIDFDINDHLLSETAIISFISGKLAGFAFSLSKIGGYNHLTKKISFNLIDDDPAYPIGVPNAYLKAEVGDEYVLLNISMPSSYRIAEENKLLSIGTQLLSEGTTEQFDYEISVTPKWALMNSFVPVLGNTVNLKNAAYSIDVHIRIVGYTRDLQNGWNIQPKVANKASVSDIFKQLYERAKINDAVTSSGLSSQNKPGVDTLDSVAKRGRFTSQVIEPRGAVISDIFAPPSVDPSVSEMEVGRWYMSINEATPPAGSPPTVITKFIDLFDVDPTGRQADYVVYWDPATGKHRYKAASFGPGSDVYSKTEINNFFSGVTGITGYNKGNWDSAYGWGNHALAGYALANGSNASGMWGINITGTAANANLFASYGFEDALATNFSMVMVRKVDNSAWTNITKAQLRTVIGLDNGSTLNNDISGSAKKWSGLDAYNNFSTVESATIAALLAVDVNGGAYKYNATALGNFIAGLTLNNNISGSAAYWGGREANLAALVNETQFVGIPVIANDGIVKYTNNPALKTWLGLDNGSTLTNNISGSATKWNGIQNDLSVYGSNLYQGLGYDGTRGVIMPYTPQDWRVWIGMPTGGETLQSVANRGNSTTTSLQSGNGTINNILSYGGGGDPAGVIGTTTNHPLSFWTNGGEKFRVNTDGSIRSIFNTDPGAGAITAKFLTYAPSAYGLVFRGYDNGAHSIQVQREANNSEVFPLLLNPNGGNVGIGNSSGPVTTPNYLFFDNSYVDEDKFDALKIYLYKDATQTYGIGLGSIADLQYWAGSSSNGKHRFFTARQERLRIDDNGNVGIGTSTPNQKLHVFGNILASGLITSGTGYGFQNAAYVAGRNRIWSFSNADNYGLSYHQGGTSIYGQDGIGIHFGDSNSPQFNFKQDGVFNATKKVTAPIVQAAAMLVVPKVDPVVADMPVDEWVLRIREVV